MTPTTTEHVPIDHINVSGSRRSVAAELFPAIALTLLTTGLPRADLASPSLRASLCAYLPALFTSASARRLIADEDQIK